MTSVPGDSWRTRRNSVSPSTLGRRMSQIITSKTFDEILGQPFRAVRGQGDAVPGVAEGFADHRPEIRFVIDQ